MQNLCPSHMIYIATQETEVMVWIKTRKSYNLNVQFIQKQVMHIFSRKWFPSTQSDSQTPSYHAFLNSEYPSPII